MIQKMGVILASASPRRRQLLQQLGIDFNVIETQADETPPPGLAVTELALYLARKKAETLSDLQLGQKMLITADTVVLLGKQQLGKPADRAEAAAMLGTLSGQWHTVETAVCLRKAGGHFNTFSDTARVKLYTLTSAEINYYLDHQPPLDKAGAYGIQDWLGLALIERLEGSFFTVMGLPTHPLYLALKQTGVLEM